MTHPLMHRGGSLTNLMVRVCCARAGLKPAPSALASAICPRRCKPSSGKTYSGLVADRNCVAARRGGEQRKANGVVRSESKLDSAVLTGEPARERRSLYPCKREAHDAEGLGAKAVMGAVGWLETEGSGGTERVKRGDLSGARRRKDPKVPPFARSATGRRDRACRAGVRAPIVAMKPGNAGGAKGCRKVET